MVPKFARDLVSLCREFTREEILGPPSSGAQGLKENRRHREGAEKFYRDLASQVRVGMEASGHARRFERLLRELQFELWMEDRGGTYLGRPHHLKGCPV